jgi:hypothetical protein
LPASERVAGGRHTLERKKAPNSTAVSAQRSAVMAIPIPNTFATGPQCAAYDSVGR